MSKNLQSPTKLTEFAPLQSEEKSQTVGQFISKFFKINKNPSQGGQFTENLENASQEPPEWVANSLEDANIGKELASNVYAVDINEGRSLPNVLKRISNLLALKTTSLQDYGDTELKQYWMPDSVSKECYECSEKFTTFRRRHHCRVCGQIFCSQCCNQQIPGKIFGCTGDLRVCTYCCKVVLSYLQCSDLATDLTTDLKILQESLQTKFGSSLAPQIIEDNVTQILSSSITEGNTIKRKISVGYQEEKFASRSSNTSYLTTEEKCKALQSSLSLRNLFEEICKSGTGMSFQTHRHRLKTVTQCFFGSELVDWLIFQQKANNRVQASAICQALLEGGYIECVSELISFIDGDTLYKRGSLMMLPERNDTIASEEEPSWVQQIPQESCLTDSDNELMSPTSQGNLTFSSSYMLDLNLEANTVYLSRPPEVMYKSPDSVETDYKECQDVTFVRPSEQRELAPESGWFNALGLRCENGEKLAYSLLTEAYEQHEESLMKQLLSSKGLSHSWVNIIIPLVQNIIAVIRPDKNHDAVDLDIRHYVQFKILPGNQKNDTSLIGGIVCSKNVAHKEMSTEFENPKILLLQCSIVYQRTEGRLMSLEPVLMQEHEYLRNVAARIVALQPNVVLVQRNVSRIAQDMLRQHNITLVQNVKQSVLERLARCTEADVVSAVDTHIGRPKLGTCKKFYLKNFFMQKGGTKTLMFFDGLPLPHLGATVLLRGGTKTELMQMKKVSSFMLFAIYNWRLEKSFLMDEFAMPPNTRCEFFDDSKETSPDFSTPKVFTCYTDTDILTNLESEKLNSTKKIVNEKSELINEGKKMIVKTIKDFTDPLHSYASQDETTRVATEQTFTVTELPLSNVFRKWLDDTILCISPFIVFSIPYLETELGKKCKLRQFFPNDIYFSEQFSNTKRNKWKEDPSLNDINLNNKKIKPVHPFLTTKITSNSAEDVNIQNLLANFRACGGTYEKKENICIVPKQVDNKLCESEQDYKKDVLDPVNHQKLAVLFCSFSAESNNAPAFCVNPWIVYMDFYGRNDIPLGCFLERYCFRSTYECPSKSCDTPMVKHVRRFVHNSGCVSVSLNYFENEFSEDSIVMWTWCTKCQSVSPVVPMSSDTWSYSFAKYLELKFHGDIFTRRGQNCCNHSLHHDHYQYFGLKNYVASFKYTCINIWEISLPPPVIEKTYDMEKFQNILIDDVRIMAQKTHEIFSLIQDKLSSSLIEDSEIVGNLKQLLSKEQLQFKQKVEDVQLKLTSPTIENKDFDEKELHAAYWKISDILIKIKKSVVETVEIWNTRLSEVVRKKDIDKKKEKPAQIESESISDDVEILETTNESSTEYTEREGSNLVFKKMKSGDSSEFSDECRTPPTPKYHHRTKSDDAVFICQNEDISDGRKEGDKRTVKNILSQLLPSMPTLSLILPPFGTQEHYTLPQGVSFPVVVYENEPSSIIAYALNSVDYKRAYEEIISKKNVEQSPSPVSKRKSNYEKEKSDDDKSLSLLGFLRNKDSKSDLVNTTLISTTSDLNQSDQASMAEKIEDVKNSKNCHIDVQFQDTNCNFFCRVYQAEKFAALRSLVLPIGEEAYIRSLCRSVQWNARGGKSGSNFAKTADDRFILKDMSKSEVQLFLESASNYFTYMNKCCTTTKHPTLLGKIVGIYQIIFRNSTNITYRSNLLVMENLFYNRKVTQKFDLKGSMRNRLVVPENQEGEIVLLDENLLKMTCDSPLYILPHSKAVLTAAIQNDTEFLSTQSVMDYSLLVGLDSENKELVLGIIDYIRTFTWDKRLETIVKKSGILGGQGKLPTIVSPEEYQKRFIEAMHRYFLEVPDHWAGLGKGLDI